MSFLTNTARISSLTIAGIDYTSNFISWSVSDDTANRNGCIITAGSLELGTKPGGLVIEDYDRNSFRRGDPVVLRVTDPGGGGDKLHPRGLLYVVATSYEPEKEVMSVELACRLGLMSLTEKFDALSAIVPIDLDVVQSTFSNCCASFSSNSQYVYQNNIGELTVGSFFDGDTLTSFSPGEWVSILGVTTNSVAPLAASTAIPDEIELSYQVPKGDLNEDQKGRVDVVETNSYYFFGYPAVNFERINTDATPENPNGTLDNIGSVTETPPVEASSSSCGNTPDPPSTIGNPGNSCNEGYTLIQSPIFIPATRTQTVTSTYDGPGAQMSGSVGIVLGPRVEANGQYFADDFAYCRQTWGDQCNPNGDCPRKGLDIITLGKTITTNEFGAANEVIRTTVDNYVTVLSAAKPSDWRAGASNGRIQNFQSGLASNSELYRQTRTVTEYSVQENVNVQTVTTFTSITSRGVGVTGGQNIDALAGIETKTVRRSSTVSALDLSPDIVNSSTTTTEGKSTNIILFSSRYRTPPEESGAYVLQEQIPVPLLIEDEDAINTTVDNYSEYLTRFTKGDSFGLQVGEGLRSEVLDGWKPGMPFRYYDASKGILGAYRMDSTTWGLDSDGAVFVTEGVWVGVSNGTVTMPSNLLGNSLPDLSGGDNTTPPPSPVLPGVEGETYVDSGSYAWNVSVDFYFSPGAVILTPDGVRPPAMGDQECTSFSSMTCFVRGNIVGPGQILATYPGGSVPLEYNGSLIVADATVIDYDVFSEDD